MQILLTLAFSSFFLFLTGKLKFFRLPGIPVIWIQAGFILKLFAGIALGLIYTYYYTDRLTADTFKFFDDSKVLFDALKNRPSDYFSMLTGINAGNPALQTYYDTMNNWYDVHSPFNDSRTMIRLNAFLRLFTMGYYYVHVAVICFLSFTGIIAILKVFTREFPLMAKEIFLVFMLLPSVLFWCSGLLKDSLVFFTLGTTLLLFDRLQYASGRKGINMLLFIVAIFFLMISKLQVFLIVMPLLLAWYITIRFKLNPMVAFTGVCIGFLATMYLTGLIFPNLDIGGMLIRKQQAFFKLAEASDAGSLIQIPELKPGFMNLLISIPVGLFTSLFRPFITDTGAVLNTISAIENTLILLLSLVLLSKFRIQNIRGKIIPVFCLFYTICTFSLIGMITPVLGAIVRYKAQALPFMVAMLVIVSYPFLHKFTTKLIPKTSD